jgi:O-antigen/teichoic acid export membrane protein
MTGATIAQAIPIAISPILTRIYTPGDFGIFALYMSVASILSVIATGRYELAIMLPKKDEDAINIVVLSILISFFVSFISFIIIFIFNAQITNLLGNDEISNWLYFIPLTVLLTGMYQSFNYWSNRKKEYKQLAVSRVIQSGSTATTNLGMGFGGFGSSGLILGSVLGQGLATSVLGKQIWNRNIFSKVTKLRIFALAKKYKNFPQYLIFSHGIATVYMQIPILFISKVYDLSTLGFYSFANRFINLPGSLIANSIGDVFREEATSQYHKTGEFHVIFRNTLKKSFKLSIIPFLLLLFTVKDIFSFVFGVKWSIAGEYAQILLIGSFFSFIITPIDKSALIVNNTKYILKWHIGRFLGFVSISFIAYLFKFEIKYYLIGVVSLNILFYLIELYYCNSFSKGEKC